MIRMMAKVITIEMLFQVAVAGERPQAFLCRQAFVAEAEDTLGRFTLDRNRV